MKHFFARKSQIAIYLIIALLMLLIFFFLIASLGRTETNLILEFDVSTIQGYVVSCLNDISADALVLLGKQGGAIFPQDYLITPNYRVNYALLDNTNNLPFISSMESDLSSYVNSHINDCLLDFKPFEHMGWEVEVGKPSAIASINRETVTFKLNLPVKVIESTRIISQDTFTTSHNVRLSLISENVSTIIDSIIDYNGLVDLTLLDSFDFTFTIFPYNQKLLINVEDPRSVLNNKPYHFMFTVDDS